MLEHPQRVEQFKTEIADMHLPNAAAGRERVLLRVGAALMVLGVVLAPVAYSLSHGTTNALQQRDAQVLAISGLILAVVGGALFLRYSIGQFLRFWMARLSWEQQAQTDRVVEALGTDPAASAAPAANASTGASTPDPGPAASSPTTKGSGAKGTPAPMGAKGSAAASGGRSRSRPSADTPTP